MLLVGNFEENGLLVLLFINIKYKFDNGKGAIFYYLKYQLYQYLFDKSIYYFFDIHNIINIPFLEIILLL